MTTICIILSQLLLWAYGPNTLFFNVLPTKVAVVHESHASQRINLYISEWKKRAFNS